MIRKIKNHLPFFVQNADADDQFFEKKQFSCSQSASFFDVMMVKNMKFPTKFIHSWVKALSQL